MACEEPEHDMKNLVPNLLLQNKALQRLRHRHLRCLPGPLLSRIGKLAVRQARNRDLGMDRTLRYHRPNACQIV